MVYKDGHTSGSLLGEGWKQVEEWPDAASRARAAGEEVPGEEQPNGDGADDDEYTDEEEELYVTLDLGHHTDRTIIGSSVEYQLVGMDTPTPYLKLGDAIFRGLADQIIGDELLLRDVRETGDSSRHSHIPFATTRSQRITFQQVDLIPKAEAEAAARAAEARAQELADKDAKKGTRRRRLPKAAPTDATTAGSSPGPDAEAGEGSPAEGGRRLPPTGGSPSTGVATLGKGYTINGKKIGRPVGTKTKNRRMPLGMPRLVDPPSEAEAGPSGTEAAEAAPSSDHPGPAASSDREMLQAMNDSDAEMADINVMDPDWIKREIENARTEETDDMQG